MTATGVVTGVTPPTLDKLFTKVGDDDATMGVFLAGGPTDYDSDPEAYWNAPQGNLDRPKLSNLEHRSWLSYKRKRSPASEGLAL